MNLQKTNRLWFRAGLAVCGLAALLAYLPTQFGSKAVAPAVPRNGGALKVTHAGENGIQNYEIRVDKSLDAQRTIEDIKTKAGHNESQLAGTRQQLADGEAKLRQNVPSLTVEYSPDLRAPEVIGVDVRKHEFLTGPSGLGPNQKHADQVRQFLLQNNDLFGLNSGQIGDLEVRADYTNPNGILSYVDLGQRINGIPVFRGEVRAMITQDGSIARLINNLAPGLDYQSLATNPGRAEDAVFAAARYLNHTPTNADVQVRSNEDEGRAVTFYSGQFADPTRAELMYFPTEPGVATLAWRVSIIEPVDSYYVIVDAQTGKLLWLKNTTQDQTQSGSYTVYTGDSPAPLSPTNAIPGSGIQGAGVARNTVTVIGNEAPNSGQNNLGWVTDGNNTTDGNNVQAGLDIDGVDGVDAAVTGSPNRVWNFSYNPPPLGTDAPTGADYRNGIVTNMFYWTNRYHDITYGLGFTEAARNFQNDNFGRGGIAADRVRSESQDSSGTNNANFLTQADGTRGRMQMYIFTAPTPDRDGDIDGDVFLHEMTHGLSNRLVGNASGLSNTHGGGMGEGWSDFYARSILSSSDEDVNAIYASGAYVTINFQTLGTDNYFYGIRRFPYAVKTHVGGPSNRPFNPMTLADIDPAQISTGDGAYPQAAWIPNTANEVHNIGEIWCMMLLEVRARIITRLGYAAGNQRAMQIVTDGLKVTPNAPTLVSARDAILAADNAGFGGSDSGDIWAGFATRGNGFGSSDNGTAVVESFNSPNLLVTSSASVSDAPGNNNGFPEPGEPVIVTVPVQNPLSDPATGVTVAINGGTPVNYGTINGSQTVSMNIPYTIPANAPCGSSFTFTFTINSSIGPVNPAPSLTVTLGVPSTGLTQNFDGVSAPTLPAGWTGTVVTGTIANWTTATAPSGLPTPASAPNLVFTNDPASVGESDLETPAIPIAAASAQLKFKLAYNTESTFDGVVLEISNPTVNGGAYQDLIAAGGSFTSNGYNATISTGFMSPILGRAAWSGLSNGFVDVVATLPASANGQNIKLKWRMASDVSVAASGAALDNIQVINGFNCGTFNPTAHPRADFDGDGKSDISVVRGGATWYLLRSTAGFTGISFGASGDVAAPGDYDGDGKTDEAVVRGGTTWYLLRSTAGFTGVSFGSSGDIPLAGDYDGDGKTDIAVYRPSTNILYYIRSSNGVVVGTAWGSAGDIPVAGDFDGDGKADITVFRPSTATWYTLKSTGGVTGTVWGLSGDALVPADYDGDHKDDLAVFRAGVWYILKSSGGVTSQPWGSVGDVPAPGDYDGDGKYDIAVFRTGTWYVLGSTSGSVTTPFGIAGDVAVPARYIP